MPLYRTTFPVKASAERVWDVLTAFDAYPDWNPQIPTITGNAESGSTLKMRLALPKRPSLNVSAKVGRMERPREFWWKGHILAPWFFSGERRFSISESEPGTVMVTHSENITGAFSSVFRLLMGGPVQASHAALNAALAARAEAGEANSGA